MKLTLTYFSCLSSDLSVNSYGLWWAVLVQAQSLGRVRHVVLDLAEQEVRDYGRVKRLFLGLMPLCLTL